MSHETRIPSDPATSTHPDVLASIHDGIVGTIIGSALGDAIGLYTEFLPAALAATSYPSRRFTLLPTPTPFHRDRHRMKHELGDWTDDTDHALLILLSYLHANSSASPSVIPDPKDFAARLKVWVTQGLRALDTLPLGLGNHVGSVVYTDGYVDAPDTIARKIWEDKGRRVAPNGSLMRTHPLGFICLYEDEPATFRTAARFSQMTHADPRCVVACAIGTALVRGLLRGEVRREADVDALVRRATDWFLKEEKRPEDELVVEELERHVKAPTLETLELDERQSIGYVYKALGSGVLLLRLAMRKMDEAKGALLVRAGLFEELITDLIMCGGDADTNAAFAGALLGAYLGYTSLPGHWKHGLRHEKWIMGKAEAASQILGAAQGDYDGKADADTQIDGGKGFVDMAEMDKRFMDRYHVIMAEMYSEAKGTDKKKSKWAFLGL